MKKILFIAFLTICISAASLSAWSFRIGGLFGSQQTYSDKYSPAPVGYIEQTVLKKNNNLLRLSAGITSLDSTNFEQMVLYGYSSDSKTILNLQKNQDLLHPYGVNGQLSAVSKLFVLPFKLSYEYNFKLGKKMPDALIYCGISAYYYLEKYEQYTGAEDLQQRTLIRAKKSGLAAGSHFGLGVKLNKKISLNSEYSVINSTKLNTGLNNFEFYFRIN